MRERWGEQGEQEGKEGELLQRRDERRRDGGTIVGAAGLDGVTSANGERSREHPICLPS